MFFVRARNSCNGQTGSGRGPWQPHQGVFETCLRSYHQQSRPAVQAVVERVAQLRQICTLKMRVCGESLSDVLFDHSTRYVNPRSVLTF
jgi:hypothetical protein